MQAASVQQARQDQCDTGQEDENDDPHDVGHEKGNDTLEGLDHRHIAGHGVDDEDVQADRRGDQAHFDDDERDDAEPELRLFHIHAKIEAGDDRPEDRHGQEDHGQGIHDEAEQNVEHDHSGEDRQRREAGAAEVIRREDRQLGEAQKRVEDCCAEQDQEDHRGGLCGAKEGLDESLKAHAAASHGDQERTERAHPGTFGRREEAEIDKFCNNDVCEIDFIPSDTND